MNTFLRVASAFAAGATAMYFLDPVVGRRRRALVRDKGVAVRHDIGDYARTTSTRMSDRLHGMVAEAKTAMAEAPVGDQLLHDRIRTRLGRLVERPGEIAVDVHQGRVVLRGTAADDEIDGVLETVSAMRGVEGIDNHLVTGGAA